MYRQRRISIMARLVTGKGPQRGLTILRIKVYGLRQFPCGTLARVPQPRCWADVYREGVDMLWQDCLILVRFRLADVSTKTNLLVLQYETRVVIHLCLFSLFNPLSLVL